MNPVYLSVVLSTYNDEKYIAKAIQSILNQTYPYFEFIIVNDGSTDRTLEIVKSFTDARIVIIDKPNTGLVDSLNIGVKAAKYDWIARMDGDDISEPRRFEQQVKLIKDGVAIVSSQCTTINAEDSVIGHTRFFTSRIGIALSRLLELPMIAHPTVIFNKKIFENVGGYDKNMFVAEDFDLWCKMLTKGRLIISPERLLKLRKHGGNISTTKRQTQIQNTYIGYIKSIYHIHRNLSLDEYNMIRKTVINTKVYNYYCSSKRPFSRIKFIFKQTVRYFDILMNPSIRKVMKVVKAGS